LLEACDISQSGKDGCANEFARLGIKYGFKGDGLGQLSVYVRRGNF
jgi:hypothetical protein